MRPGRGATGSPRANLELLEGQLADVFRVVVLDAPASAPQAAPARRRAEVAGHWLTPAVAMPPSVAAPELEPTPLWGVLTILDRASRLRGSVHARAASSVQSAVQG